MSLLVYLDGELVPEDEAKVSVFDHGVLYGDGVFEGIRAYSGRVFRLEQHLERLYDSARAIMLEVPLTPAELGEAVLATCRANDLHDAYIRLVVTRGKGDLGLDPRKCQEPTIFIIAGSVEFYSEEYYDNGLEVITCATRRNSPDALDPAIKSLNYLNNVLAKIETVHAGVPEGIMLSSDGYVAECTADNIFLVRDDHVVTPPISVGNLRGITRQVAIELLAEMGIETHEELFRLLEVYNAKEMFLTGTAAEIIPVVCVDSRTIGEGTPGALTQKLRQAFHELTEREGMPIYE